MPLHPLEQQVSPCQYMYTAQTALTAWRLDSEGTDSWQATCRRPCCCIDPPDRRVFGHLQVLYEPMPTIAVEGHYTHNI